MASKMAGVLVLLLAGLAVLSCCSAAETKAETKGYDSWYEEKCPPPPEVDEKCPPPPKHDEKCPPPPKQCPPPPCPPPPSEKSCPPPPPPPKYCPPPPPKVDCSKCSCNCEACPICEVCPKCEKCPPPTKCDPCPICEKCPPPTKCDPCPICEKCEECPPPTKCDPCPAPKCDPCPAPKCDPCPAPNCDPCPAPKCDPCKYGVEGFSDADTEMVNSLLDFEYVLQGFYKNAAAADFKDATVKKIASDFSGQTSSHISALTELLRAKASKKQNVNLSKNVFANIMSAATGKKVEHFDTYASGDNVLLGASVTAPMASSMSTAILSKLRGREAQNLVAAVSSQLSAQSAAVNVMLLERSSDAVAKSGLTVAQISNDVAKLQQKLNALTTSSSSSSNLTTTTTSFEASALQISGFSATSPSQVKAMLKELGFFS